MAISFYVRSGDDFLCCRLWIPEKNRGEGLVFCHGWGGGTPYDDLLEILADAGYYALRLEQRGYGQSTGKADLTLWPVDMAACAATLLGTEGGENFVRGPGRHDGQRTSLSGTEAAIAW